eukprot:901939-Pelagomonas_calceolata.AAC.1
MCISALALGTHICTLAHTNKSKRRAHPLTTCDKPAAVIANGQAADHPRMSNQAQAVGGVPIHGPAH